MHHVYNIACVTHIHDFNNDVNTMYYLFVIRAYRRRTRRKHWSVERLNISVKTPSIRASDKVGGGGQKVGGSGREVTLKQFIEKYLASGTSTCLYKLTASSRTCCSSTKRYQPATSRRLFCSILFFFYPRRSVIVRVSNTASLRCEHVYTAGAGKE